MSCPMKNIHITPHRQREEKQGGQKRHQNTELSENPASERTAEEREGL